MKGYTQIGYAKTISAMVLGLVGALTVIDLMSVHAEHGSGLLAMGLADSQPTTEAMTRAAADEDVPAEGQDLEDVAFGDHQANRPSASEAAHRLGVAKSVVAARGKTPTAVPADFVEEVRAGRVVNFVATAYCCCKKCCGRNACGITASGHKLVKGDKVIAVDPLVIPLHSLVEIEGRGVYRALDTGSAIKGARIDLWMHTHQEGLNYGRQAVKLRVVRWGKGPAVSTTGKVAN